MDYSASLLKRRTALPRYENLPGWKLPPISFGSHYKAPWLMLDRWRHVVFLSLFQKIKNVLLTVFNPYLLRMVVYLNHPCNSYTNIQWTSLYQRTLRGSWAILIVYPLSEWRLRHVLRHQPHNREVLSQYWISHQRMNAGSMSENKIY
jgi:hypothetical protein